MVGTDEEKKMRELLILPFDHRGSFQEKLFGIKDRLPTETESKNISHAKQTIYQGFLWALEHGADRTKAGILVDELFGSDFLQSAQKLGITTACPVEKSGQDTFDFEYGENFAAHIEKVAPTFVKVLVRLNPTCNNDDQLKRLLRLDTYCKNAGRLFMFELLVPATNEQKSADYDTRLRPSLMVQAISTIQNAGIEPDVWKLEGIESSEDAVRVSNQARSNNRDHVGVIVLGRGENAAKVRTWLTTAARIPGIIGFAVGRTVFWEPLVGIKNGSLTEAQAIEQIGRNYLDLCSLWTKEKVRY